MKWYLFPFYIVLFISLIFAVSFAERTIWYVHPDSTLNSIQVALNSCAGNDANRGHLVWERQPWEEYQTRSILPQTQDW